MRFGQTINTPYPKYPSAAFRGIPNVLCAIEWRNKTATFGLAGGPNGLNVPPASHTKLQALKELRGAQIPLRRLRKNVWYGACLSSFATFGQMCDFECTSTDVNLTGPRGLECEVA
jgi:hypothetical protein